MQFSYTKYGRQEIEKALANVEAISPSELQLLISSLELRALEYIDQLQLARSMAPQKEALLELFGKREATIEAVVEMVESELIHTIPDAERGQIVSYFKEYLVDLEKRVTDQLTRIDERKQERCEKFIHELIKIWAQFANRSPAEVPTSISSPLMDFLLAACNPIFNYATGKTISSEDYRDTVERYVGKAKSTK
jgi:hypothetical protein